MDLASFIPGIGPTAAFTPGASTPPPFNVPHTGLTDGTSPTTASNNMAEVYNRILLQIATTIVQAGLTIDNNNWSQLPTAISTLASQALGSVTTRPQFDNTTAIATTEFATRTQGNHNINPAIIPSGTTLTAVNMGNLFFLSGGTISLDPSGIAPGTTVSFFGGWVNTTTINTLGGSTFGISGAGNNSMQLPRFGNLTLVWNGVNSWLAADAGPLRDQVISNSFGVAIKMESGIILQWGTDTTSIGETTRSVTFAVSFSSVVGGVMLTGRNPTENIQTNTVPQLVDTSASFFRYFNQGFAEATVPVQPNQGINWFAFGI